MTYATQNDMVDRFGETEIMELTDRENVGVIDADVIGRALTDACALIDGYLATRYTLPLSAVPPMVSAWASDIARYKLWDDRAPEEVRKRYEDALAQLKQVAQGLISIGVDNGGTAPVASAGMDYYGQERVFTSDTLSDY